MKSVRSIPAYLAETLYYAMKASAHPALPPVRTSGSVLLEMTDFGVRIAELLSLPPLARTQASRAPGRRVGTTHPSPFLS